MLLHLKPIRLAKGLTLDQLSEITSLSKGFLSQLETGARQPSTETLTTLASALDVSESEMIADQGFGEPAPNDTFVRRILDGLDQKRGPAEPDFRIGTDGNMIQIIATIDRTGIDRLIHKLQAMKAMLDI